MFTHKRLIVVTVVVLSAMVFAVPSWGAKKLNDEQFVEMCKKGNTQRVIEAVNAGANVNAKDKYGVTALMWAAKKGHAEIANVLIKAGADLNAKENYFGRTALMVAAQNGLTENVNALIDAGAYVKQRDNDGSMAVDYARDNPKLKGTDTLKRLEELSR